MKIIRNNILPIKPFTAINLFGILFVRGENEIGDIIRNHESIHTVQMKEMLYIPFYLFYVAEWFVKLIIYLNALKAYRNISFEREAYSNQTNPNYIKSRSMYSWVKYLWRGNRSSFDV